MPSGGIVARFSIDASGTIKIIKLGNIGSVAARFILQTGDTLSGNPEFWGVAKIQANLDFLKNYGIFAEGSAMLQINTTSSVKTEKISLEGIPGDPVAENLNLSITSLSTSVLGEVELPSAWTTVLNSTDTDPDTAGIQAMNLEGAIVQTVIVGQKWKIITADGPVYFLEYDSTDNKVDLSTEAQTFELPAESFSIEILGSLRIKANGSSDPHADDWVVMTGGFFLRITPERFEMFVTAYASVPVLGLQGQATGLIIIDGRLAGPGIPGIALLLNLKLEFGNPPPDAPADDRGSVSSLNDDGGNPVFRLTGEVVLMLNTTFREQVFEIPDAFLPLLPEGAPTTVEIYDNAPDLTGDRSTAAGIDPSIYITANIQGSITLFDTITLSGFIGFTASVDTSGNAFIRISGAVSCTIDYVGSLSGSLDLLFYTDYAGMGPGIIGRVQLAIADAGAIPGVSLHGQFVLEVNSFSSAVTIKTFQTNIEADPGYVGSAPNVLATDPATGLIVIGDVTLDPGLLIKLEGELIIGSIIEISGHFEFSIRPDAVEIKVSATMKLLGIGNFDIDAVLRVDGDGLAAYINLSISAGFGEDIGLSFEAGATLELNTASHTKILTTADGETISLPSGFKLNIHGSVTFLGFAEASGYITITALSDRFTIEFDIMLHLGPLEVSAKGGAGIYSDGLALLLDVSIDVNMFEIIKIKAAGKLQLNTCNVSRTLAGVSINANSFTIALSGSVTFLEVLKLEASFLLAVGYEGVGSWKVEFSAGIDFFGLAQMSASGFFNYKGYFDITLDGGFTLGSSSFGLVAKFHFNVGFGERQVAGEPEGITEYYFHVGASGSASLRAFGISFASVGISFDVTAAGSGRVPLVVSAKASVKILFVKISVSMSFTIGYVELPRIVYLAGNGSGDPRLWSGAEGDGVLYLNMGSRNAQRGIGEGVTDELYTIEHVSSDSTGETVRVKFSGREKIYKGVKKIVAYGGEGSDYIFVNQGVTSDVEFHGGNGNDTLFYDGSGVATLYGDAGQDYLETGKNSTRAFIYGGADQDYIVHNGSGQAVIHGDGGSDKIFGGSAGDIIYGDADGDEIDGRGGSDVIYGGTGNDIIRWTFEKGVSVVIDGGTGLETIDTENDVIGDQLIITAQPAADDLRITTPGANQIRMESLNGSAVTTTVTASDVEDLQVNAGGGADRIRVDYLSGCNVDRMTLDLGSGKADTVTVNGSSGNDSITVSEAPAGKGILIQGTGTDIIVSSSVRADGDTLTIDGLSGNDTISAAAVNTDRAALKLYGSAGNDSVIGSRFNDVIDSGLGSDRVTGGLGFDLFFDASPGSDIDVLVETFDADVSLFNNKLVVGSLLNAGGTKPFEVGTNSSVELTDAGDRYAAGAVVEDLKGLFEQAEITGGSGNNTLVVNDRDNVVRVGNSYVTVHNWQGIATLDNGANNGVYLEHYLITVPYGNTGTVHVIDSSSDSNDRLVITGTDQADHLTLDSNGTTGTVTASGASATQISYRKIEFVEIDTRAGDDRFAVRAVHTRTTLNTAAGDDIVNIGSNAAIGGAEDNTGGTLNAINAPLTINGQGSSDTDIVNVDDTGDAATNFGTLRANSITNGLAGTTGVYLMGPAGSITYSTIEVLNIHLAVPLTETPLPSRTPIAADR